MLSWVNKQGVESENGWVFQRVDRFHYNYVEGDHILEICVESGEVFFNKVLKWSHPFDGEIISEERRAQIKSRITEAMKFMGSKYRLIEQ